MITTDPWVDGWKIVHPDGTTGRNRDEGPFQWPLPTGGRPVTVKAPGPLLDHRDSCPQAAGDGLCAVLAGNVRHVTSGDARLASCVGLLLRWRESWVIGDSDPGKVRLSQVLVTGVFDPLHLIRLGLVGADLWGADLWGADLRGADLWGADLRDANLRSADLQCADLWGARANPRTIWPAGFDPAARGVEVAA